MNLFICGFPRCGTTSLFNYLSDHPKVLPTKNIEGCYFIDENYFSKEYIQKSFPTYHEYGVEGYDEIFNDKVLESHKLDGSPDYIFQESFYQALDEMAEFRLVVILRNPVDRIFSFYQFSKGKHARIPSGMTFTQFLKEIKSNKGMFSDFVNLRLIVEHSKYINYINKLNQFKDDLLLIKYEDFVSSPKKVVKDICHSAELNDEMYDDYKFSRFNESSALKYQWIQRVYNNLPFLNSFKLGNSGLKKVLKSYYQRFNYRGKDEITSEDKKALNHLKNELMPSIVELEKEFGLDLSDWK